MSDPEKIYFINYLDSIDESKVKNLMRFCTDILTQQRPDVLYFCFSSSGGFVAPGITLYNFLMALPVKVIMHNTGSIDSIATVIFLAGAERYAVPNSTFLFHGIQYTFSQPASLTINQLKEKVSSLEEDQNRMASIVAERTKLDEDEIRLLFRQGAAKDPEFAMNKEYIHAIRNLSIPANAGITSFNL
ncbi:MAG: ATP-dependent Clp protease proteolytic subunit [Desulfobacterales bacterium]|uniref:ATP-dependent Clp protease proteolytic subunit n=1 Tax=Candidatus Desulfatibia vada TaxID=2841696 RepID=A0A8J6TT32_9BACT|nr:ATP-dependent Clp protease proteolytic subunit [Candidatus Desulfatibia vada]